MSEFRLPVLGFGDRPRTNTTIKWQDGTAVGILSLPPADPEIEARLEAERERKAELRAQPNVVLLEDFRNE